MKKKELNVGTVKSIWLMIMNLVIVKSMMSKENRIIPVLYTKGGLMLPKMINTQDFIDFCEENNYIINKKTQWHTLKILTAKEVIHEYDEYTTTKDIKANIHSMVMKEVELYKDITLMTPMALSDHITDKLLSDSGLELLKKFIELKED